MFCLGHQQVSDAFIAAAWRGIKGAVIYDGSFAEQGEQGLRLQYDIQAICRDAGIALCGPNCMGMLTTGSTIGAKAPRPRLAQQP